MGDVTSEEMDQRQVLEAVARGDLTPEEAAERLGAAGGEPRPRVEIRRIELDGEEPDPSEEDHSSVDQGVSEVKVSAALGTVRVTGDPSIAGVSVDGPHVLRQEDGVLIVESEPMATVDDDEDDDALHAGRHNVAFSFVRLGQRRHVRVRDPRHSVTEVRVNPDLPVSVDVSAGTARVSHLAALLSLDVSAGSCKVTDHAGPVQGSVAAGSLSVRGRLTGASDLSCEAGALSLALEPGSDVTVEVDVNLGNVKVKGPGAVEGTGTRRRLVVGEGAGRLDVSGNMSSVKIEVVDG